jgi:hypothetical protein
MPKQSAKQPEVVALEDEELLDELGESAWEPEPAQQGGQESEFVRELEALADQLRLPVDALQRLQVAAILTLVRETQKLRETVSGLRVVASPDGGFDAQRFRDLIKRELKVEIDNDTLKRAFRLAGDPSRLERAISYVQKSAETGTVQSPVALLLYTLNRWRDEDGKRRQGNAFPSRNRYRDA